MEEGRGKEYREDVIQKKANRLKEWGGGRDGRYL